MPQSDPRRNSEFADILEGGNFIAPAGIDESVHKEKKENKLAAAIRKGWLSLPKPVRATACILVCSLLLAALALYVCWLMLPQLAPEIAFRMEERKHLVGPMEIREIIELPEGNYNRVILAEDANGIAVYRYHSTDASYEEQFRYYEKNADITLIQLPMQATVNKGAETWSSFMALFDSYPDAVRAKLELTLYTDAQMVYDDRYHEIEDTWNCVLEAQREKDGYFLFEVTSGEDDDTLEWIWKTRCLQKFVNSDSSRYPMTLRLYDAEDKIVLEKTW